MSWLFSRALAVAFSEATCSDGGQSAPSSSNPISQAYCSPDKMTAYSRLSRFGMTYAPLTDDRGAALLTWYLEASRARISARQEKEPALTAPAPASGGKCTELSMKYDRNSHSWKTHLCLWEEDLPESSVTLPASGMMLHGVCWELTPLDYPIAAPDYGFLPTPRACIGTHGITWSRAEQGNHKCNLEDYLAYLYIRNGRKRVRGMCVSASFVALMMGWPQKWTSLKPLATGKFLQWRQLHSGFYSNDSRTTTPN
nr:hypothetical protein [Akkermansia sp.]